MAVCEEFDEYAEALQGRYDGAVGEDEELAGRWVRAAAPLAVVASLVGGVIVW